MNGRTGSSSQSPTPGLASSLSLKLMKLLRTSLTFGFIAAFATATFAEDAYYRLPLKSLAGAEQLKSARDDGEAYWGNDLSGPTSRAVLDSEGEVYLDSDARPWEPWTKFIDTAELFIRAPKGAETTGRVYLAKPKPIVIEFK